MNILISNQSGKPIYEQIGSQVRAMILTGELEEGALLPSMRALARDLRISVITTKRAYDDLERDGFIETIPGKGCFVSRKSVNFVREQQLLAIEGHLRAACELAQEIGLDEAELAEMLLLIRKGD